MTEQLSWEEISKKYKGQWVELIDYSWDETKIWPEHGVVRVHSADRKEFDSLMLTDPPADSAVLFVGPRSLPKGTFLSSNLCLKSG